MPWKTFSKRLRTISSQPPEHKSLFFSEPPLGGGCSLKSLQATVGVECWSALWSRPAVSTVQRWGQKPPLLAAFSKQAVKTMVFDKGPDCVGVLGEKTWNWRGVRVGFWMLIGLGHKMELSSAVRTEGLSVRTQKIFRHWGRFDVKKHVGTFGTRSIWAKVLSLHPTAHVLLLADTQQLSFGSVLNGQHKNSEEIDLYA